MATAAALLAMPRREDGTLVLNSLYGMPENHPVNYRDIAHMPSDKMAGAFGKGASDGWKRKKKR